MISGNEELLGQMIWNILDNAIKYTPADGKVKVLIKKSYTRAEIVIADTGIGIPAESLTSIFTRFYRVEQSHSREIAGSGLGLAISKWITELHKGKIIVNSQIDKGSEFVVMLPLTIVANS